MLKILHCIHVAYRIIFITNLLGFEEIRLSPSFWNDRENCENSPAAKALETSFLSLEGIPNREIAKSKDMHIVKGA